ncbi:hypothetical protein Nepgr_025860 [Nepenthes gracilis]|uniref:RRM domain-containing protein n=1 Tax=Nepenthes gracilis TaxID=150966 RepID=A0AAD3T8N8_NEPGR|nr:hypothetical protein Nepgr_025860 [Nepenthes gracilis]
MRTRNADTPKSSTPAKKTPPTKKSITKTPTLPVSATSAESTLEVASPKSSGVKQTSAVKSQPVKSVETETTPTPAPNTDEKPGVAAKASGGNAQITPTAKDPQAAPANKKVTKRVVRKKIIKAKTPVSAKVESAPTLKSSEADEVKVEELSKEEDIVDVKTIESPKVEEKVANKDVASRDTNRPVALQAGEVEHSAVKAGESQDKGKGKIDVEGVPVSELRGTVKTESLVEKVVKSAEKEESNVVEEDKEEQFEEEVEDMTTTEYGEKEPEDNPDNMDEDTTENVENETYNQNADDEHADEEIVEYGDDEAFVEPGEEDLQDDDGLDAGEEAKALEEEHMELTAAAEERKIKKELEVFVGGLDREVVEDDVKKAFEKVGEVVEVRLLKDPSTNKNRGFAFVTFATKEQASRALEEMKNPVICGKRCGTAPSEDNDTLFLGNICNTWTKEAIRQKLTDYGVEGVEHITLVQDPRHEGLSRGFCFIQFSCHADAMLAYKRLQKPDVIFGHAERTAKVAFAEPLREPDPDVMANVKSVFVDGLPPHWDEDRVREHFKHYGEIERIMLARNMSTAKRKDFGFVDFSTHEAAIACIEDVNTRELVDGKSKAKVRARLSNPLPKTQAVKGGMCGGFRIGFGGGRSFGRGTRPFSRPFQYGRGFYQHSRGQFYDPAGPYPAFQERRPFSLGGRRIPLRSAYHASGANSASRPNVGGPRHGVIDRGPGRPVPSRREIFPPEEEGYAGSSAGRNFDDPYLYDDRAHGIKRPLYMTDQDPGYMESSRPRPRFNYSDPGRGNRHRDAFGAGSSLYSSSYYGSDYGGGPYSSFHGGDRSFGGGYYY